MRVGPALGAAAAGLRPRAPVPAARRRSRRRCCSCRTPDVEVRGHRAARRAAHRGRREREAARRTCGAPSTRRAGRGRTATTSPAPTATARDDTFVDGVSVFVPALRPRDRPQHAGGRARRRRRTCCRSGRSRCTRNPSEFGLDQLALRGARRLRRKLDVRGDRRGARTSSASPITTPTASWPTATTPRWPTCGSTSSSATAASAPWRKVDELRSDAPRALRVRAAQPLEGRADDA